MQFLGLSQSSVKQPLCIHGWAGYSRAFAKSMVRVLLPMACKLKTCESIIQICELRSGELKGEVLS